MTREHEAAGAGADAVGESRMRLAGHLAELRRVHLALAQESRGLKRLTISGQPLAEIELAAEMLEQYLGATDAFLENMRGRFEVRLGLLRRNEPQAGPHAEFAPGHGEFWLSFSRLCAALRRAERRGAA